ncbi:MurR/RpiR family transcriptional regulator [Crassaminicella profunda]|uniref:MurR/RpiR family transcriptional regulator n=1 Tax=Crassaminicella profunda TaxID=1286698 RepID=UPI001CA74E26|nr:MurR/RpiR family transcriptional regulator [Crassaminicella profunda]QZY55907.1 MurR/RpiR family transcriptional regulator [Crassaminicella profunda]
MIILNIIKRITNKTHQLSNKQKVIANYLIQNKDKVGFMILKEMSEHIGVSEVTILNFCKSIGLDSFTEMKKQFQELIKKELHVPNKMKSSLEEFDNVHDIFNSTIQIQKLNLEKMIYNNTIDTLQAVCQSIEKARTVYICGSGVSKIIADYLNHRLRLINIDSRVLEISDMALVSRELTGATEEDYFILISFPIYSHLVINLSRYLTEKSYPYVALTDHSESPIAIHAKNVLTCNYDSLVFYNFISAAICLVELMLVILCFNMKDRMMINLKALEEVQRSLLKEIYYNE